MSREVLIGVDLGTSGVKALAIAADPDTVDRPIAEVSVDYPLSTPRPGWSEQDPEDWWRGSGDVIRELLVRARIEPERVIGLAVSGQMHGATLLDATGNVVRPAILWNDQRSGDQCVTITERIGFESLIRWVANPALAGFTAPKVLWVREHEPEAYRRIASVLLPKDYLNYRLTGELATEVSDASGTLLFDVVNRRWSGDMLKALDLAPSMLPPVRESTDIVGRLHGNAARHTGLREGTPVVAGGADNACAAIGVGVIGPGQVMTSLGTSGTVVAASDAPRIDPEARLHTFCHAVPGVWYLMGVVLSAGGSLRWYRDALGGEESRQAAEEDRDPYEVMMEEAAGVEAGSEGLVFLPYLTGERTPHGDPDARGVFFGLSLRHSRAHVVRSIIEGVTYALADSTDIMRSLGIDIDVVRTTGGGSRSVFWRQMQADVLRARVVASRSAGPAVGAAVLAGLGVGVFESPEGAVSAIRGQDPVVPAEESCRVYERYREIYDRLYPALSNEFHRLAAVIRTEDRR